MARRRQAVETAEPPRVATSRRTRPEARPGLALLRGRGDERGRPATPGSRRDVWTAVAPDIGRLQPSIEEGDKVFAGAATSSRPSSAARSSAGAARARAAPTATQPAAGDVPHHRLAAGDVDLDRRPDRLRRRADRAVAAAGARARRRGAPRYARARRARARPRLSLPAGGAPRGPASCWSLARRLLVSGAAAARARRRGARREERRARRARGRARGQVPRDPRRRARLPDGKLSEADWRELDRRLRAEAVEMLHELGRAPRPGPGGRVVPWPARCTRSSASSRSSSASS